jgi:hypothetical protein
MTLKRVIKIRAGAATQRGSGFGSEGSVTDTHIQHTKKWLNIAPTHSFTSTFLFIFYIYLYFLNIRYRIESEEKNYFTHYVTVTWFYFKNFN